MSGLALFVSKLVSRESTNRRFQFGYWHIEPMVLAFNAGTLIADLKDQAGTVDKPLIKLKQQADANWRKGV
mgnify:CR=1 FL=1